MSEIITDNMVADIFATMENRVIPEAIAGITADYGYIITGEGGGEWTVRVKKGQVTVVSGVLNPDITTTCAAQDWIAITLGKLDGMTAFSSGKLMIKGDMGLLIPAAGFFSPYTPAPAPVTVADIFATMEDRVNPDGVKGITANCGYVIKGEGGGEWTVRVTAGEVKVIPGLVNPDVTTTCKDEDWIAITLGKLDGMTAFSSGKLVVEGNLDILVKAARFFHKYTPPGTDTGPPPEELIVLKQVLSIPHTFSTGPVMGRFLTALKEKKILANQCPECKRLQIPPREVCAECVVSCHEFVEVGPEGSIATPDVAYYASPDPLTGETRETPYCSCHFLLDGCKGHETMWHELKTSDIPRAKRGARVRPVWSDILTGAVTDIKYFEIVND